MSTLIADVDPADWLFVDKNGEPVATSRMIIRIDGPLPTVYLSDKQGPTRPLRAGDRVTLATLSDLDQWIVDDALPVDIDPTPFATATVAEILDPEYKARHGLSDVLVPGYHITVTDVQALQ